MLLIAATTFAPGLAEAATAALTYCQYTSTGWFTAIEPGAAKYDLSVRICWSAGKFVSANKSVEPQHSEAFWTSWTWNGHPNPDAWGVWGNSTQTLGHWAQWKTCTIIFPIGQVCGPPHYTIKVSGTFKLVNNSLVSNLTWAHV